MLGTSSQSALIVIADEKRRVALDCLLRNAGFTIRNASNGVEGLLLAMEVPDVIILDLQLSDMSAFEVCCRLKADPSTAAIPVLHLLNGLVESVEVVGHMQQGDEAFHTHPPETTELLQSINSVLQPRHAQQQLTSFLEATPDAVIITDLEGKIVRVNGQTERMFGHLRHELLGQTIELLLPGRFKSRHPNQRSVYASNVVNRPMGTGPKLWGLRSDGTEFPVEVGLSPILDHEGILIVSVVRDVTEREQIEAMMRESEIRFRRLFETAKDGILILDTLTGRISDANPFMSEMLGYSHEHFLGKELWEIGLFADKAENQEAVKTLQNIGYIRYEHLPLEGIQGQAVEVEVVANAYMEEQHKVIQCNVRDITERSRLERQMQAQAIALEDLHRRKDEFLAVLSHELRNPLAPIANAVQLLKLQKNQEHSQSRYVTVIERQVKQLTRLIDDLLDVSRITNGRVRLQRAQVTLNRVVERGVEATRSLIEHHDQHLQVSLSLRPIWVHADAARLEQVVVNLLTNAAKYTPDGGHIEVTVSTEGDQGVIRVQDSGVGITPELLPKVFDLFTQAEQSLARSDGGLGIGLSLVKRLVEMHGGTVEVTSVPGQGSEFVVRLPMMTSAPPEMSAAAIMPAKTVAPLRVLVVDDNLDAAQSLGLLLEVSGHEVYLAYDGHQALHTALDRRPNIVFLDLGLPGLNGYEVAKRIREQFDHQSIVLVAMTGYGNVQDLRRTEESGFDHHLIKPADFTKIKELLASVPVNRDDSKGRPH